MKKLYLIILCFVPLYFCSAQNDTSSPYSLFALGVENKTATSGLTGLGNSGIGQRYVDAINIYNPANLGNIQQKTFLYEFGLNGSYSVLKNQDENQSFIDGNISHVVIAFPLQKNIGLSLGLLPYTKVGYNVDIINTVEGSTDKYISRIRGNGGLNKFFIASGFNIDNNLSLGLDFSFLFGSINQETIISYQTLTTITDNNHYTGVKFKAGLQYTLPTIKNKEITLGAIVEFPTKLSGSQIRNSYKETTSGQVTIDDNIETDLNDFELPIAYGFGVSSKLNNFITTNLDFKRLHWNSTNQYQNNERYINQNIYALGLEYTPLNKLNTKIWNRMKYRFGINYNTGFLNISKTKIDSYFTSFGLGIPLSKYKNDWLNISYSYGKEGTTYNNLIQENFHKITLNLNFVGKWFAERKID
ncbi:hypothetical protein [Tenacibaculum sp. IB213877]|uniref:hypothetical protein n=1 Tax=Tenacibaculum sp. IB213877 TaxID=3097351 RepID=UPI002A5A3E8C|nr:hypothetical protein [Tenacibaculum sp. IB213877]MDY0781431.1 hypothetical protein [Tenacibaculum sp. IB213877]